MTLVLVLGLLIFSDPLSVESKSNVIRITSFSNSFQVWSSSFIYDHTTKECQIVKLSQSSHRKCKLTNSPIHKVKPLYHEIDPIDTDHCHGHDHVGCHSHTNDLFITLYHPTKLGLETEIGKYCAKVNYTLPQGQREKADVVTQLISNGPPSNRIDVVFMGDGYLSTQLNQMEDDMRRLTRDMFQGTTFSPYLPVFNIWSVFRASNEEGVGVNGRPKDTAFGLYRDGTELRGVYCSKPEAARSACSSIGPESCDFPSLIGNDPFYGGLGGEFTISTQSPTSGTIVLRHEMGHNFINVGEEYDGGSVYSGVNHSPIRNGVNVPWKVWLTEPEKAQLESSIIQVQEYAWYDLANGPFAVTFTSTGEYAKWSMRFSLSGCETDDAVMISLDGNIIPWRTSGTLDRVITDYVSKVPLQKGGHTLTFTQRTPPKTGNPIRQLCSVTLHEYRAEPYFHMDDPSFVGVYPTWRGGKVLAGYRPTNELCLMRNMSSTVFCPVCYEGMWMEFLSVISLIDDVTLKCEVPDVAGIQLNTLKLGQLREGGAMEGERLEVKWYYEGVHVTQFDDYFSLSVDALEFEGKWRVSVQYRTPFVRADPLGLLVDLLDFEVLC